MANIVLFILSVHIINVQLLKVIHNQSNMNTVTKG
nr:MAG TPA: hypothetical protein [Caudoviricetes sp.]